MADGEIRLNTKLDNREFITGSKQLTTAIKNLQSTTTRIGKQMAASAGSYGAAMRKNISAVREFEQSMRGLEGEANLLRSKMAELGKTKLATNEYKRVVDGIAKAEREYDILLVKKKQFEAEKVAPATMDALYESMGKAEERLNDLRIKQQQMLDSGHAYKYGSDTAEYKGMQDKLSDIQDALRETEDLKNKALEPPYLKNWNEMLTMSSMVSNAFGKLQYAAGTAFTAIQHPIQAVDRALGFLISKVWQTVSSFAKMAGNAAISYLKRLAAGARNAAIQLAKLAASAVSSGIKKIGSAALYAARAVLGLNKNTKSANGGLKVGLSTILKYGFGIRSMYFLFRKLRSAISEGFGELSKSSPEVKAALNGLQASLNGLKGSLASAFAPILTAVAPMLTTLINMLTAAMNTVAAFFAALTGKSTVTKSIASIGSSAKKSGGSVKDLKKELAGFDTLNILNDKNSGGGGGGGSGGGLAYKTEEIDKGVKEFVDQMKKLWEAGDYAGIGKLVAGKINKMFATIYKKVRWKNVSKRFTAAIDAFTGIFNGLTENINWNLIGKTFGAGIDTLINAANRLITGVNWVQLGSGLAHGLNGIIDEVDGDSLGSLLGAKLQIAFDALHGFVTNFEWGDAGTLFGETILSLTHMEFWNTLGTDLGNAINGALEFIGSALSQLENDPSYKEGKGLFATSINNLVGTVDWFELGRTLARGIKFAVNRMKAELGNIPWGNAGTAFATTLNTFFSDPTLFEDAGDTIEAAVKGLLEFGDSFLSDFNSSQAAENLKKAIRSIDWDGIAEQAWALFKLAVAKLGNFLTVLFGGESLEVPIKPVVKPGRARGSANRNVMREQTDSGSEQRQSGGVSIDTTAAGMGRAISSALEAILNKITEVIKDIPWADMGTEIHNVLAAMDWSGLANGLWTVFSAIVDAINDLLPAILYGKDYKDSAMWQFLHPEETIEYLRALVQNGQNPSFENTPSKVLQEYVERAIEDGAPEFIDALLENLPKEQEENRQKLEGNREEAQNRNYDLYLESLDGASTDLEETAEQLSDFDARAQEAIQTALENGVNLWGADIETIRATLSKVIEGNMPAAAAVQTGIGEDDMALLYEILKVNQDLVEESVQRGTGNYQEAGLDAEGGKFWRYLEEITGHIAHGEESDVAATEESTNTLDAEFAAGAQKIVDAMGSLEITPGADTEWDDTDWEIRKEVAEYTKRQTKETKKNTKALIWNAKQEHSLDLNVDGTALETLEDGTATATVQVGFVPEGQQDEEEPTGLLAWLQQLLDPGVSVETKVSMVKDGWTNFWTFIGSMTNNPIIKTLIEAVKQGGWTSFLSLFGITSFSPTVVGNVISKTVQGFKTFWGLLGVGGTNTEVTGTVKTKTVQGFKGFLSLLGITGFNPVVEGSVKNKASTNGFQSFLSVLGITSFSPTVSGTVNSTTGQGFQGFLSLLGVNTFTPTVDGEVNVEKGSKWVDDAFRAAMVENNRKRISQLTQKVKKASGDGWNSAAYKVSKIKNGTKNKATLTESVKQGGTFNTKAYNATQAQDKTVKTTVDVAAGDVSGFANTLAGKLQYAVTQGLSWLRGLFGLSGGGSISSNGFVRAFASGGAIMRNGRSSWWNSVNKYAAGTSRAHGTVFVAGESGPEIMGHVNGRTEILNKSQLADALYGAVVSGMSQAVNALGAYIVNHMTVCTNAIVSTIAANSLPTYGLSSYYAPAMASGAIMPYEVAAQIARSTADIQNTLDTNNEELIQAMVSAISNAAASIVMAMNLHGNNNNAPLTARAMSNAVIDEINRRTRMTGQSPLMGV